MSAKVIDLAQARRERAAREKERIEGDIGELARMIFDVSSASRPTIITNPETARALGYQPWALVCAMFSGGIKTIGGIPPQPECACCGALRYSPNPVCPEQLAAMQARLEGA